MAANTVVMPPPIYTGDLATDVDLIKQYLADFYEATVLASGLLDPSQQQGAPQSFTASAMPDPQNTTLSTAQDVANKAYLLAGGT